MIFYLKFVYIYITSTIIVPIFFIIPALINRLFYKNKYKICQYYNNFMFTKLFFINFVEKGFPLIDNGIVISNHITIFDGGIDSAINNTECIARRLVNIMMLFNGLIVMIEKWGIMINRNNTSRHDLIKKIKDKLKNINRILLYPEGTRKKYYIDGTKITKDLIRTNLKYGTLKSIYNEVESIPIQINISSKERILLECLKIDLYIYRSDIINPKDYNTFEDFIDKIIDEWVICYNKCNDMIKY